MNLTVVNELPSDPYPAGFYLEVLSAEKVEVVIRRPFFVIDGWSIECSGPSTDNGDGSFSCPAGLQYLRAEGIAHLYEGQGLLTTWPDAEPKYAAYVGTTSYSYSSGIGRNFQEPTRVGQAWTEQLRFQDGDDTATWPPTS